jgi:hypothetical protein
MSTSASFDAVMGSRRGADVAPWERLSSVEQEIALAAARSQFLVHVVHYDGGQYVEGSQSVRTRIREFAAAKREICGISSCGIPLIKAVSEHFRIDRELDDVAAQIAHGHYSQWLDCGQAPTVTTTGPVIAVYADDNTRICRDCARSRERSSTYYRFPRA